MAVSDSRVLFVCSLAEASGVVSARPVQSFVPIAKDLSVTMAFHGIFDCGSPGQFTGALKVWVDWNRDGAFDASEVVYGITQSLDIFVSNGASFILPAPPAGSTGTTILRIMLKVGPSARVREGLASLLVGRRSEQDALQFVAVPTHRYDASAPLRNRRQPRWATTSTTSSHAAPLIKAMRSISM